MKSLDLSRYALCSCAAAAMLAGCGGSQPPIGAPGTMPQTAAQQSRSAQRYDGASWMAPEAKSENLMYITDGDSVVVLTYPKGKVAGTLTGLDDAVGDCADASGNVWIMNSNGGTIEEFAHGGTTPIATLHLSGSPQGCSVDPINGDLAVAAGDVLVWSHARGAPKSYAVQGDVFAYCGYDDQGNLFADGFRSPTRYPFLFEELPKGGHLLEEITLTEDLGNAEGHVQWDGHYITIDAAHQRTRGPFHRAIYRVRVSGYTGKIIGASHLSPLQKRILAQSWILGNVVVIPYDVQPLRRRGPNKIGLWNYPAGGAVSKTLTPLKGDKNFFFAVTVSLAPR